MTEISVEQLKARMDAGEKLNLLDVREPSEYAEFNFGAPLFPLGKIQGMQIEDIEHLRTEEVIINCRSGKRSMMACMMLEQMGFTNTVNVIGGVLDWQEKIK